MLSYLHPYALYTGASYTGGFDRYTWHMDDAKITLPRIPVPHIPVILTGIWGKRYLNVFLMPGIPVSRIPVPCILVPGIQVPHIPVILTGIWGKHYLTVFHLPRILVSRIPVPGIPLPRILVPHISVILTIIWGKRYLTILYAPYTGPSCTGASYTSHFDRYTMHGRR